MKRWLLIPSLFLALSGAVLFTYQATATVNEVTAANRYTANGSTTVFAYTFKVLVNTAVEVSVNSVVQTLNTHYTVSGVGASGGGSVTFLTAPANTAIVTILRNQPAAQSSAYTTNEAFPSSRLEKDLDRAIMAVQQLKEQMARALTLPKQSTTSAAVNEPAVGSFARAKVGGGFDWATVTSVGSVSVPVAINQGGTGGTTAAGARTNLGLDTVFNVKHSPYNAVGNGIADDTAALQAAINDADAVGGTFFLPVGTYLTSARLTSNGTAVWQGAGWGSIIKVDAAAARFLPILVEGTAFAAINGVVMRDFKVDGSLKGQLDAALIQINNGVGFLIDHLWVTGGGTPGESAAQGVNGIATSAGALGAVGSQGTIQNSLIEATTKSGINWSTESINGLIIGNIVRNCTGNTSTPGIQVLGGYNVKVIGNHVYNNQGYGIFLGVSGGAGTYRHARHAEVAFNHVYSNGQGTSVGDGIFVGNAAASASQFGRILISHNHVYSNGVGINANGILVQNENNVQVGHNYIYANSLNGLMIEAAFNVKANDNTIESNNTANVATGSGIHIKAAAGATLGSIDIVNNKLINIAGQNQKYPIFYDNTAAQAVVGMNILDNISEGHVASNGMLFDQALPQRFHLRHRVVGQVTTDAAITNVFYGLLRDDSAVIFSMRTVAVRSDGAARAMYSRAGLFFRDGAGALLQGALQTAFEVESDATWDQTLNVSGNFVRGRITGVAATTITWDSIVEIQAE